MNLEKLKFQGKETKEKEKIMISLEKLLETLKEQLLSASAAGKEQEKSSVMEAMEEVWKSTVRSIEEASKRDPEFAEKLKKEGIPISKEQFAKIFFKMRKEKPASMAEIHKILKEEGLIKEEEKKLKEKLKEIGKKITKGLGKGGKLALEGVAIGLGLGMFFTFFWMYLLMKITEGIIQPEKLEREIREWTGISVKLKE